MLRDGVLRYGVLRYGVLQYGMLSGVVCLLAACASPPPAVVKPVELTPDVLSDIAYQGLRGVPAAVTLPDKTDAAPAADGAAGEETAPVAPTETPAGGGVHWVDDLVVRGQLLGDTQEDAVILLEQWTGPSSVATYAAVVTVQHQQAINVATVWLGDNVQVRDMRIENALLAVDLVNAGVDDSPCCPSQRVTMRWQWQDNTMKPLDSTVEGGRLSIADIANHEWQLAYWQQDEPDVSEPPLTLSFQEGKFTGFAGCNRYFTTVLDGQMPGDILVTQPAATRMACPEPASSTETRFLSLLGKVERFTFTPRGLALAYHLDNQQSGVMYFQVAGDARRNPPPEQKPVVKATPPREEPPTSSSTNGFDVSDF